MIDNLCALLRRLFPEPRLPQKRYIIIALIVLYVAAKAYVHSTPDPYDDKLLEEVHQLAYQIIVNQINQHEAETASDSRNFGESS